MTRFIIIIVLLFIAPALAFSQTSDTTMTKKNVFHLGEVVVHGLQTQDSVTAITSQKMEKFNRQEVSTALNILPGINLANVGPRNESVIFVRGFDLRQVPVFIDGVPVYVPYDGYVDLARFTTFDLSSIQVSKGFASILYGANTMGGAINLVTRKPQKSFELQAKTGMFSGDGYLWSINNGLEFGKFYTQIGISQIKQDYQPLSNDYEPTEFEDGDKRENSYRDDVKFNVKVGFRPNETDEYAIGYVNQHAEKGTPPYAGSDANIRTRFWQWPKWNKQSVYFISSTQLSASSNVKTRLYYDTFVNDLYSYDDGTYTSMTRPYTFQSYYDDYTYGGIAEYNSTWIPKNKLNLAIQYKHDVHRENDLNEPQRNFEDYTISVSLEDTYTMNTRLTIFPGISYNIRNSVQAQDFNADTQEIIDFPSNRNDAFNAQLGAFYQVSTHHDLKFTLSHKTRFATIKDRYSYRMGQAIPNPDLASERSINYDITYSGNLRPNLTLQASVFRSDIHDIIQQVDNVEPERFQLQNAGKAEFYGSEIALQYTPISNLNVGANYAYIKRENKTNPDIYFTDVPEHTIFGFVDYQFHQKAGLLLSIENNSSRYSTSYGTKTGGFTLINSRANVALVKNISLEAGINNIFDVDYSLVEGFPAMGRNYFVNLVFSNL